MDFIKKAKKALNDAENDFKKLGINIGGDSAASTPGQATPATTTASTPAPSVAPSAADGSDLAIPHSTAAGAVAKIPLSDRKKIRDDFDAKKPELEQQISQVLGDQWTIHADTIGAYTYMTGNGGNAVKNPGVYIRNYFDGLLFHLKYFQGKHSSEDVASIGQYAPRHLITLEPTSNPKINYVGTDFQDGKLRILFNESKEFGMNAKQAGEDLSQSVNAASKSSGTTAGDAPQMSMIAKKGIRDEYEAKVPAVLAKAQTALAEPSLSFEPNFEANYATLAALESSEPGKLRKDWERIIGPATLDYFSGFNSQLGWQKFAGDDMMQEGFKELVTTQKVSLLVTPACARGRNDCIVENGVLVMRVKPDQFWVNVNDTCDKLSELL